MFLRGPTRRSKLNPGVAAVWCATAACLPALPVTRSSPLWQPAGLDAAGRLLCSISKRKCLLGLFIASFYHSSLLWCGVELPASSSTTGAGAFPFILQPVFQPDQPCGFALPEAKNADHPVLPPAENSSALVGSSFSEAPEAQSVSSPQPFGSPMVVFFTRRLPADAGCSARCPLRRRVDPPCSPPESGPEQCCHPARSNVCSSSRHADLPRAMVAAPVAGAFYLGILMEHAHEPPAWPSTLLNTRSGAETPWSRGNTCYSPRLSATENVVAAWNKSPARWILSPVAPLTGPGSSSEAIPGKLPCRPPRIPSNPASGITREEIFQPSPVSAPGPISRRWWWCQPQAHSHGAWLFSCSARQRRPDLKKINCSAASTRSEVWSSLKSTSLKVVSCFLLVWFDLVSTWPGFSLPRIPRRDDCYRRAGYQCKAPRLRFRRLPPPTTPSKTPVETTRKFAHEPADEAASTRDAWDVRRMGDARRNPIRTAKPSNLRGMSGALGATSSPT